MRIFAALILLLVAARLQGKSAAWEMAEQFRTFERTEVAQVRKDKLHKWLGEKRPQAAIPDFSGETKNRETGVSMIVAEDGMILAVDKKNGLPQWLSFDGGENILANASCLCPLWELRLIDSGGSANFIGSYDCRVACRPLVSPAGVEITYSRNEAVAKVTITRAEGPFVRFAISVENLNQDVRFDCLEFPKLALIPRGAVSSNVCAIPWRRGRLRSIEDFRSGMHEEYPGSSARFQMTALYDEKSRKGIYFASEDGAGNEKDFLQTYIPAYGLFVKNLRSYSAGRGNGGNSAGGEFTCILGCFEGDWFDAGQIYRRWYLQQSWAARGPLHSNDTPEFLKHAPVWLRFYLRESRGLLAETVKNSFDKWQELFPGREIPATLYHYARFDEPENKPKYPVCEYYGYCAPAFPGLPEILKDCTARGLRCSVFIQSEIYNQDLNENKELDSSRKLQADGSPLLYLDERGICCRMAEGWLKRSAEMRSHLMNMGFTGFYQDTFGKSKPVSECFDVRHGHCAGGSNTDYRAQRTYGEAAFRQVRGTDAKFYLGGEASCECYVDLLDYKLNAVSSYPGHIPLEREIYGDYILSHGRTVGEHYTPSVFRQLGFDFLEGAIFGRFFGEPPKGAGERDYLVKLVQLSDAACDYIRLGRMLRPLKFGKPVAMMSLTEPQKMQTEEWRNAVYRSYRDGSVGIAVFRFGEGNGENTLILSAEELELPENSRVMRLLPNGHLVNVCGMNEEIPLTLPGNGFDFFVIQP